MTDGRGIESYSNRCVTLPPRNSDKSRSVIVDKNQMRRAAQNIAGNRRTHDRAELAVGHRL
jgi:hypothetical protein